MVRVERFVSELDEEEVAEREMFVMDELGVLLLM